MQYYTKQYNQMHWGQEARLTTITQYNYQWRKPGAEFGGTEKFFADQNFWWPFFNHRPGFSNFPSLLPNFPDLYFVTYRTQPFPHKKNTIFTLFILLRASDNTTSQNIGGDECMGRPPTSNFGGDRPPSSPRFSPLLRCCYRWIPLTSHSYWLLQ